MNTENTKIITSRPAPRIVSQEEWDAERLAKKQQWLSTNPGIWERFKNYWTPQY